MACALMALMCSTGDSTDTKSNCPYTVDAQWVYLGAELNIQTPRICPIPLYEGDAGHKQQAYEGNVTVGSTPDDEFESDIYNNLGSYEGAAYGFWGENPDGSDSELAYFGGAYTVGTGASANLTGRDYAAGAIDGWDGTTGTATASLTYAPGQVAVQAPSDVNQGDTFSLHASTSSTDSGLQYQWSVNGYSYGPPSASADLTTAAGQDGTTNTYRVDVYRSDGSWIGYNAQDVYFTPPGSGSCIQEPCE